MNGRVKRSLLAITVMVIIVLGALILHYRVDKSYSTDANIISIQQFVDENDEPTKVSIVLENINLMTLNSMSSNKYRVYSDDVSLTFTNSQTNEVLNFDNSLVTLTEAGVTLTANNIAKGNKYDIIIEPVESQYGYKSDYKKATIEIDYTDKLTAYVKEVLDNDNNPVEVDNKAIFLYTDDNNKIKLRANADVDIEYVFSLTELSDEQLNNAAFTSYDKNNYLPIHTNGYLYAKAKYKTNGYSQINMIHITNIDKLEPSIALTSVVLNGDEQSATVNYTFDDAAATLEYGKSGIKSYAFSITSTVSEDKYIDVTNETSASSVVQENGTYYIHVKDRAGNKASLSVNVDVIPEQPADYVLIVLDSPVSSLNGVLFKSFNDMTNRIHAEGIDASSQVTAQVLKDIRNQSGTFSDIDLKLDLNGYTISSNKQDKIFNVENTGKLSIDENRYNISDYISETSYNGVEYSSFENGELYQSKIISTADNAIQVNSGGTLTIGVDETTDLKNIAIPSDVTPYIEGDGKGVSNNGTMNYYDGVIVGNVSLNGQVQDTPYLYDPSVVFNEDLQKQYMTLQQVSGIEALIDKTRYTLLEDAISAANDTVGTPNDQIEIDVVKNLTKTQTVEIPNSKNIIIDLNGYNINGTSSGYVFNNFGKTKITSSLSDGTISTTTNTTIYNNPNANLEIAGGFIDNQLDNGYDKATIHNDYNAVLTISGGKVTRSEDYLRTIYNNGTLNISDGIVTSEKQNTTTIYNEDPSPKAIYDESEQEINVDLNTAVSSQSSNPFNIDENGDLVNSVYTSRAYVEVDLTDCDPNDYYDIIVNADVKWYIYYDYGYAWVTETPEDPSTSTWPYLVKAYSNSYSSSNIEEYVNKDFSYTAQNNTAIRGGKKYYVHFYYRNNYYSYKFKIHSVKAKKLKRLSAEINVSGGTISKKNQSASYLNYASIYSYSNGNINISGGVISDNFYNALGTVNMTGGELTGKVITGTDDSSTSITKDVFNISGGYIVNLQQGVQPNSNSKFDNDKFSTINMTGGEVYNLLSYGSLDDNSSSVIITGGTIMNELSAASKLTIKNVIMTVPVIYNGFQDVIIDNVAFIMNTEDNNTHYALYIDVPGNYGNNYLTTTTYPSENKNVYITNTTFNTLNKTSGSGSPEIYAINFNSHGLLFIEDSTINCKIEDTYTGSRGTSTKNALYGIYTNSREPNIYITDSRIKVEADSPDNLLAYAIYNNGAGVIKLGQKNGVYNRDGVKVESSYKALYNNSANVRFYDGYLKSRGVSDLQVVYDVEEGYYLNRYEEDGYNIIDLTNEAAPNVYNVQKNQYYNSISQAISSASANDTLRVDADTLNEGIVTIGADKTVNIDFNGKNINIGGITNNGNISFSDSVGNSIVSLQSYENNGTTEFNSGNITIYGHPIVNNSNMTINAITLNSASFNGEKRDAYVENYGTLTVGAGAHLYKDRSDIYISNIISNYAGATLNVNGGTITNAYSDYAIKNEGTLNISGGTVNKLSNNLVYKGPQVYTVESDGTSSLCDTKTGKTLGFNCSYPYIPIDLTDKQGEYTLAIDTYDYLVLQVTDEAPTKQYIADANRIMPEMADNERYTYTHTLNGGKKYYVYFANYSSNITGIRYYNNSENVEFMDKGVINITDGTMETISNNSIVNMSGGSITSGITNNGYADFNMTGGTISGATPITAEQTSYVKVDGGTLNATTTGIVCRVCNKVDFKSGIINTSNTGISMSGYDSRYSLIQGDTYLNMSGGEINAVGEYGNVTGISLGAFSTLNMTGGTITASSDYPQGSNIYGIYGQSNYYGSATANITSGTITATGVDKTKTIAAISGPSSANTSVFNVTLGEDDGNISQTDPCIHGTSHGILKSSGDLKFYDGILKGDTQLSGGVSERADGAELLYDNESDPKTLVLVAGLSLIHNSDTDRSFATLNKAVSACLPTVPCNLEVLLDFTINGVVEIPDNKVVNLDLKDHTVTALLDNYILNRGSLKITNGTMIITTQTQYESIIDNYGTLEIGDGALLDGGDLQKIKLIKNRPSATLNMTGGKLVTNSMVRDTNSGSAIHNAGGIVNLNGGVIEDLNNKYSHSSISNFAIFNGTITPKNSSYDYSQGDPFGTYYADYNIYTPKENPYIALQGDGDITIPIDLQEVSGEVTFEMSFMTTGYFNAYYRFSTSSYYPSDLSRNYDGKTSIPYFTHKLAGGKKYYLHLDLSSSDYITGMKYYNDEVYHNYFEGTINIDGATILSNQGNSIGVLTYGGEVNFKSGYIKSETAIAGTAIKAVGPAVINVTDGVIQDKQYGIYTNKADSSSFGDNYGTSINLKNVTYITTKSVNDVRPIYMTAGGFLNIDGFNWNFTTSNYNIYGITLSKDVKANIKNLDMNLSGNIQNTGSYYGIYAGTGNTINITDSIINVSGSTANNNNIYGIYINGSGNNISIDSSSITADGASVNNNIFGVYFNGTNDSNLILGNDDGQIDETSPSIVGKNSGISNNYGYVRFYDGVVKGEKNDITMHVATTPEGYNAIHNTVGSQKVLSLGHKSLVQMVGTDQTFGSISEAANACTDNQTCELKLLDDILFEHKEVIPNKKNVTIDFDQHEVIVTNDNTFESYGYLTLENGTIRPSSMTKQYMMINGGNLTIKEGMTITNTPCTGIGLIKNNMNAVINLIGGTIYYDENAVSNMVDPYDVILNTGGVVNLNSGILKSDNKSNSADSTTLIETTIGFKNDPVVYYNPNDNHPRYQYGAYMIYNPGSFVRYYVPIDLTSYTGEVSVEVVYDSSYNSSAGNNAMQLTDYIDDKKPAFASVTNNTNRLKTYTKYENSSNQYNTIMGGKVYYLHVENRYNFRLVNLRVKSNGTTTYLKSNGTVNINGATLVNGGTLLGPAIKSEGSTVVMNSGTIKCELNGDKKCGYAVNATDGSTVVTNPTINFVNRNAIQVSGKNTNVYMYGLNTNSSGIVSCDHSRPDGTFDSALSGASVYINNLDLTIDGVNSFYNGAPVQANNCKLVLNGYKVDLKGNTNQITGLAISNLTSDSVIENTNIKVENTGGDSASAVGIEYNGGTSTIHKATVEAKGSNSTGLKVSGYPSTLTLGEHDGTYPNATDIVIKGDTYGVNVTGSSSYLNYNDGKFISDGTPVNGQNIRIPTGYRIVNNYNYAILGLATNVENTFEFSGVYYNTLDAAINTLNQSDNHTGTIKVWNGAIIGEDVTIPSGANVTLALEGHAIEFNNAEAKLINNGTLTIIDGDSDEISANTQSYIVNNYGTAIQNNGTLTLGATDNPNSNSPAIRAITPISGNSPTIKSGKLEVVVSGVGARRTGLGLLEPSYSYKYNNLQVNRLPNNTVLAAKPGIRSVDDLTVWTNQDISVGITSHNHGVLNIFTNKDYDCVKDIKYTVEVYKNGSLDEFSTFDHVVEIYCLDNEVVPVDKDYFDNVPKQFKDFYITRVVLNGDDITTIPDNVDNNSVFKLYYGQSKGEEIDLTNPKTGRTSYKKVFIITVSVLLVLGIISFIYRLRMKNNINM